MGLLPQPLLPQPLLPQPLLPQPLLLQPTPDMLSLPQPLLLRLLLVDMDMLLAMDTQLPPSVLDSQPLLMLQDKLTQRLSPTSMTPLARDPLLLRSTSMTLLVMLAVMSHLLPSPTSTMPLVRLTPLLSPICTLSPLLPSQPLLTQLPLLAQPLAMLETMAMLLLPLPSQPQPSLAAMLDTPLLAQLLLLPSTLLQPQWPVLLSRPPLSVFSAVLLLAQSLLAMALLLELPMLTSGNLTKTVQQPKDLFKCNRIIASQLNMGYNT